MNDPMQSLAMARLVVLAMPFVLLISLVTNLMNPEQGSSGSAVNLFASQSLGEGDLQNPGQPAQR